jgi:uncharacterized protein
MARFAIRIPRQKIAGFCRKWHLSQLSLFGSVTRDDFDPERSDVDVLIAFAANFRPSLFDLVRMREELQAIFGRDVDLLTRDGVESSSNLSRRRHILDSAEPVYAA